MCREVTGAVRGRADTPAGPHTSAPVSCKNTLPSSQHLPYAQLATWIHPHTAQPIAIKARTAQRPHRKWIPSNSQIPCPSASSRYRHRSMGLFQRKLQYQPNGLQGLPEPKLPRQSCWDSCCPWPITPHLNYINTPLNLGLSEPPYSSTAGSRAQTLPVWSQGTELSYLVGAQQHQSCRQPELMSSWECLSGSVPCFKLLSRHMGPALITWYKSSHLPSSQQSRSVAKYPQSCSLLLLIICSWALWQSFSTEQFGYPTLFPGEIITTETTEDNYLKQDSDTHGWFPPPYFLKWEHQ